MGGAPCRRRRLKSKLGQLLQLLRTYHHKARARHLVPGVQCVRGPPNKERMGTPCRAERRSSAIESAWRARAPQVQVLEAAVKAAAHKGHAHDGGKQPGADQAGCGDDDAAAEDDTQQQRQQQEQQQQQQQQQQQHGQHGPSAAAAEAAAAPRAGECTPSEPPDHSGAAQVGSEAPAPVAATEPAPAPPARPAEQPPDCTGVAQTLPAVAVALSTVARQGPPLGLFAEPSWQSSVAAAADGGLPDGPACAAAGAGLDAALPLVVEAGARPSGLLEGLVRWQVESGLAGKEQLVRPRRRAASASARPHPVRPRPRRLAAVSGLYRRCRLAAVSPPNHAPAFAFTGPGRRQGAAVRPLHRAERGLCHLGRRPLPAAAARA
jgi:hypothetical protein